MATASSKKNIEGFYRQKKNPTAGGISKSTKSSSKPSSKNLHSAAAFGSDVILPPPALISHGGDLQDNDENEGVLLKQFDINMAYGPCLGMARLGRWERARRLGLNPPIQIESLLLAAVAAAAGGKVEESECLWAGRV